MEVDDCPDRQRAVKEVDLAGSTWAKRQREKAKQEKKAARRMRRDMRREGPAEPDEAPDQDALMERFAQLNEALAQGRINRQTFEDQRDEIWEAMGLPPAT